MKIGFDSAMRHVDICFVNMNRNLKNELSQTFENENEIDNIIQKVIPYNLDFGCTLIKQAVIESAEDVIKKDSSVN